MDLLCKKSMRSRFEELYEKVEIEHVVTDEKEAGRRICAAIRALIEIDQILSKRDSLADEVKEAS
jgi:hypothetical protein